VNRRPVVALALAVAALAGCRSTGTAAPPSEARTTTVTITASPTGLGGGGGEETSKAATAAPSLTPSGLVREVAGSCPYIDAARFADLEGSRVGRVTVLRTRPEGCRFYFQYDPSAIVGEITIARFPSATEAYNAMVESARKHPEVQSDAGIGDGSVAYRTDLQGNQTWQCVFAKGTSVVTVRTRQPYPALNAFSLARAIAPKVP
jgi:hypothetical protein